MNKESIDYQDVKHKEPIVYVIQELPGTSIGRPKFNIMGALKYGIIRLKIFYYFQAIRRLLDWHARLHLI